MPVRTVLSSLVAAAALLLILFIQTPLVRAQSADEIQAQIDSHNQQIKALDAEIAQYQKQLDTLGTQHQTLATSIQSLDTQRKSLTTKIASLQAQIATLNLQLKQLGYQIADKQQSITLNEQSISQMLRDIDMTDSSSLVEQIFSATSLTDAWAAVDANISVNEALGTHTEQLAQVKNQLAAQQDSVNQTQSKLVSVTTNLGTQKKAVDVTVSQKNQLLTQTKNQESTYQSLISQKRAEQASFEADIFKLSQQLKAADNTRIPAAGKGILAWPLDKITITQLFGKTSDSGRLYVSGTHNGVDFGTPIGTPVKAALTGTVLATNYITAAEDKNIGYCQYGSWILIQHANGLDTLYAHLSQISVSKGQTVSTGQVIGYSGNTGYATGPHLHLGVYNASSVSFTNYTCNTGYKVYIPIAPTNGYLDPMIYL